VLSCMYAQYLRKLAVATQHQCCSSSRVVSFMCVSEFFSSVTDSELRYEQSSKADPQATLTRADSMFRRVHKDLEISA